MVRGKPDDMFRFREIDLDFVFCGKLLEDVSFCICLSVPFKLAK